MLAVEEVQQVLELLAQVDLEEVEMANKKIMVQELELLLLVVEEEDFGEHLLL